MKWRLGVDHIATSEIGTYRPADEGAAAFAMNIDDELTDAVAWFPKRPNKWFLRWGDGDTLNPDAVEWAIMFGDPLTLWRSPDEFILRGKCQGAVILRREGFKRLLGIQSIIPQDFRPGKWIEQQLRQIGLGLLAALEGLDNDHAPAATGAWVVE